MATIGEAAGGESAIGEEAAGEEAVGAAIGAAVGEASGEEEAADAADGAGLAGSCQWQGRPRRGSELEFQRALQRAAIRIAHQVRGSPPPGESSPPGERVSTAG